MAKRKTPLRVAWLLIFLSCRPLFGDALCLAPFAGAAADGGGKDSVLIATTYEKLLELPTSPEARGKLLAAIAEHKDPFYVPESEAGLDGVRDRMTEFRDMLGQLKWADAAVKRDLLKLVRAKNAGREKAAGSLKVAVATSTKDVKFPLRGAAGAVQTPDGRYVIGPGLGTFTPTFEILDTQTGKKESFPVNGYEEIDSKLDVPRVNSDGTKLYFVDRATLRVWPLVDGKPVLTKGETLLDDTFMSNEEELMRPQPLANPDWILLEKIYAGGLHLYDLKKQTFRRLPETEAVTEKMNRGGGPLHQWAVATRSNTVVLLAPVPGKGKAKATSELRVAELDRAGKTGPWKTVATFPKTYETAKGKGLAAKENYAVLRDVPATGAVSIVSLKNGAVVNLKGVAPPKFKLEERGDLFLSPTEDILAWSTETWDGNSKICFFDFSNPEKPALLGVNEIVGTGAAFTPDGQALLVKTEDEVKLVNFKGRWSPR